MPAYFLSFEGIDKCGKSTQIRRLNAYLNDEGVPVLVNREPGGTSLGEAVRAFLLYPKATYGALNDGLKEHSDYRPMEAREERSLDAETLLFLAARAEIVSELIIPALRNNITFIADRFIDSTEAYQGAGKWENDPAALAMIQALNAYVVRNCRMPDKTFFLDIPLEERHRRAGLRTDDVFESKGNDFFGRVLAQYQLIAKRDTHRVVRIDGMLSVDEIFEQHILPVIKPLYGL